ncbi:hypothetical protein QBC36DRAFT_332351 [Triangularia setosa]|uniref:NADH dehydrogenase [ubiquinone] 1 alpha subcomplex subunit 12 n=1 Tax=Triangularia setosa TaxID=2587417 RepID=A0AAN7A6F1_9PEZI|nr:hypothetical protein QBC36DRAFT_332351 [Podospora setosa]
MSNPPLTLLQKWKSLRLPWRRHFLVGKDLAGNTYWEFHDRGNPNPAKWRRILRPNPSLNLHHADVKIPPAWHQWLRHTRPNPPTIEEQQLDLVRQERLKILAAEADKRWEAKPRYIEDPSKETRKPALEGSGIWVEKKLEQQEVPKEVKREEVWEGMKKQAEEGGETVVGGKKKQDPWKQKRAGPGEEWQPQGWTPGAARKP